MPKSLCLLVYFSASNIFFLPSIPDMASTFLRQSVTSSFCRDHVNTHTHTNTNNKNNTKHTQNKHQQHTRSDTHIARARHAHTATPTQTHTHTHTHTHTDTHTHTPVHTILCRHTAYTHTQNSNEKKVSHCIPTLYFKISFTAINGISKSSFLISFFK